jgi:hypothetical protein
MHDTDPPAAEYAAFAAEPPAASAPSVHHHPVRREIARDLPDWDLLPPSTVITVRRLAR